MFKFIKKLVKVVAAIVGAYLAFNTLVLAKIGASRVARQIRLKYPDRKLPDSVFETMWEVDGAVIDEADEEWAAWDDYKSGK